MGGCGGCLLALLSLIAPRLVIVGLALFTEWISMAYETAIWPFLGWVFMPFTTLAYCAAMVQNEHQVTGGWIVLMIVAIIFDLGSNGNAASNNSSSSDHPVGPGDLCHRLPGAR